MSCISGSITFVAFNKFCLLILMDVQPSASRAISVYRPGKCFSGVLIKCQQWKDTNSCYVVTVAKTTVRTI